MNYNEKYNKNYNNQNYKHKMHIKFFPSPQHAIYALVDKDENVVYVGSSMRTAYRLAQHLKYKTSTLALSKDLSGLTYMILEDAEGLNRIETDILEQHYADIIKPELNTNAAITDKRRESYFRSLEETGQSDAGSVQDGPDTKS